MKKCPFCGADIEDSARFCLYCMQSLTEKEQVLPHKKKRPQWLLIIAAIVAASLLLTILLPGQLPEDWSEYLDPETDLCPLGDMCISLQRAAAQAKEFGHPTRREIGYLTIHSMLHLLGYDHLDEGAMKAQMRNREEAIASTIRGMSR